MKKRLNKAQILALFQVVHGADVYHRGLALRLREVAKLRPELISVGPPEMFGGKHARRRAFLGACASEKGVRYLRDHLSRGSK